MYFLALKFCPFAARSKSLARPEPEHTVADLAHHIAQALEAPRAHAEALRAIAEARFDWQAIAEHLAGELQSLPDS